MGCATTTEIEKDLLVYWKIVCPTGTTQYALDTTSIKTEVCKLPPESRPKPDGPLYLHPTPRDPQWTRKSVTGFEKKGPFLYGTDCTRVNTKGVYPTSIPLGELPTTNWQLDARNKIKGTKINLGAHLVEYRSTGDMFYRTAKYLLDRYKAIKRLRPKYKATDTPESLVKMTDVSSLVLATNLGLKPLLSDFDRAVHDLNTALQDPIVVRFSGKKTQGIEGSYSVYDTYRVISDRYAVYCGLVPPASWVTLGNIPEHLWEITPMSYFVDFLIPVGQTLSALDALKGVKFLAGTLTTKERFHAQQQRVVNSGYYVARPASVWYKMHQRTVLPTIPLPEFPRWSPSYTHTRLVNALAALHLIRSNRKV